VTRIRLIAAIAAATAFAMLGAATPALAGTYTWNLASDFTATPPGANPDHDQYGASPWSYSESQSGVLASARSHDPSTFQRLGTFAAGIQGGLAGWQGADATAATVVAINPSSSSIITSSATFPGHQIAVVPANSRFAAIGWKSPLSQAATVLVSATLTNDGQGGGCLGGATWSLDQNGTTINSGSVSGQSIQATPTVQPGGSLYLTIDPGVSLFYNAACVSTRVVLQIVAAQSSGPNVTLVTPAQGALISGGQPSFSGTASNAFGASITVTVHVYQGTSATGTPVENLIATRSGSDYSVAPAPALDDGTYTARTEQDDRASPPDVGLSNAVTFTIHNAAPSVVLDSPGGGPLTTATPTLTGTAGTAPGDGHTVAIGIFAGAQLIGAPVRTLSATVGQNGHFSIQVTPPLDDGQYTAIAAQPNSAGTVGESTPRTFRIKTHGPAVTLDRPAENSQVVGSMPTFSGSAGTALGDSNTIFVTVHAGGSLQGRVVANLHVTANGSFWSVQVPFGLPPGQYTAQATQSDDAGHTSRSTPHTFSIVATPGIVGSSVRLDARNAASVSISCREPAGNTCSGTVLVLTSRNLQAVSGGPVGQLRIIYAFVTIPAGGTVTISQFVPGRVAAVLRRRMPVPVIVTASLSDTAGRTTDVTARRLLRRT
jgi:hypothetical protein